MQCSHWRSSRLVLAVVRRVAPLLETATNPAGHAVAGAVVCLGVGTESDKELRKHGGVVRAKKVQTRLADLRVAETLADMRLLPGRCHEVKGDRAGQLSLDLDHPYRLLFRPARETEPLAGGGLDWTKVTEVVILEIADTHGT